MAYALVTHGAAAGNGSVAPSVTLDTTGADRIFTFPIDWFGVQPLTVTDSKGNTYTALTDYNGGVNFNPGAQIFYSQDAPAVGSGHTFSNPSAQTSSTLAVLAVSGSANSPFDTGTDHGNSNNNGTSIAPSSACVPGANNELVLLGWCCGDSSTAPSAPTGFTLSDSIAGVSGTNYGIGLYYQIQTTATSQTPTLTNGSSAHIACAIAAFKAAGGATFNPGWATGATRTIGGVF